MSRSVKKKFVYIIFLILSQLASYAHGRIGLFNFSQNQRRTQKSKKISILSIFTSNWMGGAEICALSIHKLLHQASYDAYMLVYKGSPLQKYLQNDSLPHYAISTYPKKSEHELPITQYIRTICRIRNIRIVQCHSPDMAQLARIATKGLRVKIVLMYHGIDEVNFSKFQKLDGVITVNPRNESLIRKANAQLKLKIKKITQMYPFFDEERFLKFKPKAFTRKEFFMEHGFDLQDYNIPVICMVANFYGRFKNHHGAYVSRKNQELLIRALHGLITQRKKNAYVVFLGDGAEKMRHEKLSKDLGIDKYIFFAGFYKEVEEFLYHTDIHALTSGNEPLGIVYLEAGLMKKPSIGAFRTGADYTIVNGVTGFVFKNNDLKDLIDKLEILIDDSELRRKMGRNAFEFVMGKKSFDQKNRAFLTRDKFKKLKLFYKSLNF